MAEPPVTSIMPLLVEEAPVIHLKMATLEVLLLLLTLRLVGPVCWL